jgi:hypothetical protein
MTNNAWEWNWLDLYFIGAYILYLSNALFVRASGEIKGGCALSLVRVGGVGGMAGRGAHTELDSAARVQKQTARRSPAENKTS